ncbi:MAG: thioredoxin family protein [Candidatus Aenigmarchaeota archaeon]|nr:thioredoxin family protein [Candidatus Aenigmarchaeota archaeon]
MVDKMKEKDNIYVKSLVISIFIFLSGMMFGILIDNYRISHIRKSLMSDIIFWDDSIFLTRLKELYGEGFCSEALELNLLYNQKIYERGKEIEEMIKLNRFAPEMREELRKYTLMQVKFWLDSRDLKEKCNFTYKNVLYLQEFFAKEQEVRLRNKVQSNIMLDVKERCGNKILLIPINMDLNLTTVDVIKLRYNVTRSPTIIIDDKIVLEGIVSLQDLLKILEC